MTGWLSGQPERIDNWRRRVARNIAVGLGLMEFPFSGTDGFWRWVDLCEAGGIEFHLADRPHRQPRADPRKHDGAGGDRRPDAADQFGVNVVSLALRDPVLLAKQCATIDVLSQGRLLPGFGIGSPQGPEWRTLNIDTRRAAARPTRPGDHRRLWREETVDFEGRHIRLTGASISPKPVQPDLPIWIGGSSEAAVRRTARYGTGWQAGARRRPMSAGDRRHRMPPVEGRRDRRGSLRCRLRLSVSAGVTIPASAQVMEAYRERTGRDPSGISRSATPRTIVERIGAYVEAGVRSSSCARRPRDEDAGTDAQADRSRCCRSWRSAGRGTEKAA